LWVTPVKPKVDCLLNGCLPLNRNFPDGINNFSSIFISKGKDYRIFTFFTISIEVFRSMSGWFFNCLYFVVAGISEAGCIHTCGNCDFTIPPLYVQFVSHVFHVICINICEVRGASKDQSRQLKDIALINKNRRP
jgi:hypothetical protein